MDDSVSCSGINNIPYQLPNIVSNLFNGIKIIIPIMLIIICMIDLAKFIIKENNFELKEALGIVKSKLILCIIIFLVPSMVQFIVSFSSDGSVLDCVDCFLNGVNHCTNNTNDNVSEKIITLKVGETLNLNSNNAYLSSDTSVATIENGVVYALLPGDVIISSKYNNEEVYYIKVVDSNYVGVKKIKIENKVTKLIIGDRVKLNVTYEPNGATNTNLLYESLDDSIISIDNYGNMTAKNIGKTTISVLSENGIKTSREFTVINSDDSKILKSIKYKNKEIIIDLIELDYNDNFKRKEFQLELTKDPIDSNNILKYEILDNDVATINNNGKIIANKEGKTTVIVTSDNGLRLEIPLIVREVATKDTIYKLLNKKFIKEYYNNFNNVNKVNIEQIGLKNINIDAKVQTYINGDDLLQYYSPSVSKKQTELSSKLNKYNYNISVCENKEQTEKVKEYLTKVALTITKECNNVSDKDYCKLSQIRNWMTKNMVYGRLMDIEGVEKGSCAYNTIYNRKTENGYYGTCHAYSTIFYLMSNAVGVKTKMIPGSGHVYNISLVNGKWYYSDITWDDVSFTKTTSSYYYKDKYLLFGENYLLETHYDCIKKDTLVDVLDGYPVSKENYKK